MLNAFAFRASLFMLLAIGAAAFIGSCKNPTAPREPNKFASQATFLRRLDSIRVGNANILLTRGVARNALSLANGDLLFVGELQRPGSLFRSALVVRTNALGGIRWSKLYTDSIETLNDIVPTSNGEFIAIGNIFTGIGQASGYAFRIDSLGNVIWSRVFNTAPNSLRFSGGIRKDNSNTFLYGQNQRIISVQPSRQVNDGYILLIDPNGNAVFEREIRSLGSQRNIANAHINFNSSVSLGGEIILAGFYTPIFESLEQGTTRVVAPDLYLLRLNSTGNLTGSFLFDALYPAGDVLDESVSFTGKLNSADEAYSVFQLPDGTYAVYARSNGAPYVLIVNSFLNAVVRRVTLSEIFSLSISAMNITRDGNFIFVGTSTEKITREGLRSPAPGGRDVYIAKCSPQGNLLWEITQGTSLDDEGLTIQQTIDDGYIITGISNNRPLLLKVDERGLLAE